jgi:hypothetical protein
VSIFASVLAEYGEGPPLPQRHDFSFVYGYYHGASLGMFPNEKAAIDAGASIFEVVIDEVALKAARDAHHNHDTILKTVWQQRLRAHYQQMYSFPDKAMDVMFVTAFNNDLNSTYEDVERRLHALLVTVQSVIAAM